MYPYIRTLSNLTAPSTSQVSLNEMLHFESVTDNEEDFVCAESTQDHDSGCAGDGASSVATSVATSVVSSVVSSVATARSIEFPKPIKNAKKRINADSIDTNEILREFLKRKPDPIEFIPTNTPAKDNLDHFFDSIASTMRTFPPVSIARIKLQISQIVGEEEIKCAENCQYVIHVVEPEQPQQPTSEMTNDNETLHSFNVQQTEEEENDIS